MVARLHHLALVPITGAGLTRLPQPVDRHRARQVVRPNIEVGQRTAESLERAVGASPPSCEDQLHVLPDAVALGGDDVAISRVKGRRSILSASGDLEKHGRVPHVVGEDLGGAEKEPLQEVPRVREGHAGLHEVADAADLDSRLRAHLDGHGRTAGKHDRGDDGYKEPTHGVLLFVSFRIVPYLILICQDPKFT